VIDSIYDNLLGLFGHTEPLTSLLWRPDGPNCPAGKSIWSALGSGTVNLDDLNTDLDTLLTRVPTEVAQKLHLVHGTGTITPPTNKGIWDYLPNLDNSVANLITRTKGLDDIHDDVGLVKTDVDNLQAIIKFPSDSALDDISVTTADQPTTELSITVSIPTGASIVRAMLAAFVTIMNDTANAQKITVKVQGRVYPGGSFSTFFSQANCIGFPAADGATTGIVPLQDVTALVTSAQTYGFKCLITQSSANSVHYTTQFLLLVTYKMS